MIDSWWEGEHAQLFRSTTFTMNQLHFSRRDLPWLAVLPPAGYSDGSISQMSDCQSGSFSTISKGCQNCHTQHITIARLNDIHRIFLLRKPRPSYIFKNSEKNNWMWIAMMNTQDTPISNILGWTQEIWRHFCNYSTGFWSITKLAATTKVPFLCSFVITQLASRWIFWRVSNQFTKKNLVLIFLWPPQELTL